MAKLHGTRVIRGTTDLDLLRVLSNEEVALQTPSVSGNPKFSFYQTTTERAYLLYNTGANFEINSDTTIRISPSNTASFDFSGLNLIPVTDAVSTLASSTNRLLEAYVSTISQTTGALTLRVTGTGSNDKIVLSTSNTARFEILNTGDLIPSADVARAIGSSSRRLTSVTSQVFKMEGGDLKIQALGGTSRYIQFDIDSNSTNVVRIQYPVSTNGSQIKMQNALASAYLTGSSGDGADSQSLIITPTDFNGVTGTIESRGASIELTGNEKTTALGSLYLKAGSTSSSHIILQTNSSTAKVQYLLNASAAFELGLSGTDKRFGPATGVSDAQLIGPSGQFYQSAYLTTELAFNPGANQSALIRGNTVDGTDNQRLLIAPAVAASSTRGAYISVCGNEFSGTPGALELIAGNTGAVAIGTTGAQPINFYANNAIKLNLTAGGDLQYINTSFGIYTNTADGSDTNQIIICGGGGTAADGSRGAFLRLQGNESSNGRVDLSAGTNGGDLYLSTKGSGHVIFEAGGSARWRVRGSDGSLYKSPGSAGIVLSDGGAINCETVDGADNAFIQIYPAGGVGTGRSAIFRIYGNEHTADGNAGGILLQAGNTTGNIVFRLGNASSLFNIQNNSSVSVLNVNNSGNVTYSGTNFSINADTTDASDNKAAQFCGGGSGSSTRGSLVIVSGNEHTLGGDLYLVGGQGSNSSILVDIESTGGRFAVRNTANESVLQVYDGGTIEHKSHSNFVGSGDFKWTRAINTTDNTFNGITSFGLADNTSYMIRVRIIGRLNSTVAKSIWGVLELGVFRNNAGSATLIGTPARTWDDHGTPGYDFRAVVTGNDVVIEVKGATGETVSWSAAIEMQGISTSA